MYQVYVEAFTCPCVRSHPFEPFFVAQSNGNYIAIFSLSPPFKLNKYKRYESHGVSGFPIKCVFSLDGEKLVSGSSDGSLYFYDYRSSELVRKIKAYEQACIDVAIHPVMPNVIASCSWNGEVSVFEWVSRVNFSYKKCSVWVRFHRQTLFGCLREGSSTLKAISSICYKRNWYKWNKNERLIRNFLCFFSVCLLIDQ